MTDRLDSSHASCFARLTMGHLGQEFPNKLDHVMADPNDALPPAALHPIFFGSFDWHSCVHGWWQVLRLLRLFPDIPEVPEIEQRADALFTKDNVAAEKAYLDRPHAAGFERPYGWAWLLALHLELDRHPGRSWALNLEPLARTFADWFHAYLPKLTYPIRHGVHTNTAFALVLAHAWASRHDAALKDMIERRGHDWFAADNACQSWEPSGDEFLSPTLIEALAMSRLLPLGEFARWFDAFLPDIGKGSPATLLKPAFVSDRTDGKIAHLDGLNLSRAWCWRQIAAVLPDGHAAVSIGNAAADRHIAAALPFIVGDYMGEHWLATYALLALQDISR